MLFKKIDRKIDTTMASSSRKRMAGDLPKDCWELVLSNS
jgi:hypothetical protein